jgi:hypothetical protein
MTPEAQRIAIAEACPGIFDLSASRKQIWCRQLEIWVDPIEDLNAMHEAEKTLTAGQCEAYDEALRFNEPNEHDSEAGGWGFHRNAAQRAEFFLRAKGLWTE